MSISQSSFVQRTSSVAGIPRRWDAVGIKRPAAVGRPRHRNTKVAPVARSPVPPTPDSGRSPSAPGGSPRRSRRRTPPDSSSRRPSSRDCSPPSSSPPGTPGRSRSQRRLLRRRPRPPRRPAAVRHRLPLPASGCRRLRPERPPRQRHSRLLRPDTGRCGRTRRRRRGLRPSHRAGGRHPRPYRPLARRRCRPRQFAVGREPRQRPGQPRARGRRRSGIAGVRVGPRVRERRGVRAPSARQTVPRVRRRVAPQAARLEGRRRRHRHRSGRPARRPRRLRPRVVRDVRHHRARRRGERRHLPRRPRPNGALRHPQTPAGRRRTGALRGALLATSLAILAPVVAAANRVTATLTDRLVGLHAVLTAILVAFLLEPFYAVLAFPTLVPLLYALDGTPRKLFLVGSLLTLVPIALGDVAPSPHCPWSRRPSETPFRVVPRLHSRTSCRPPSAPRSPSSPASSSSTAVPPRLLREPGSGAGSRPV